MAATLPSPLLTFPPSLGRSRGNVNFYDSVLTMNFNASVGKSH